VISDARSAGFGFYEDLLYAFFIGANMLLESVMGEVSTEGLMFTGILLLER